MEQLEVIWKEKYRIGPSIGYYLNPKKCVLRSHQGNLECSPTMLEAGIQIRQYGVKYLGGYIGQHEYTRQQIAYEIQKRTKAADVLKEISHYDAFAAFTLLTKCIQHKQNCVLRMTKIDELQLEGWQNTLLKETVPSILKRDSLDEELCGLLTLTSKQEGMGIRDASRKSSSEFDNSNRICTAYEQNEQDYSRRLKEIRDAVRKENIEKNRNLHLDLIQNSEKNLKSICTNAAQTGASSWITTYGNVDDLWLNTTEFHNAVANRYSLSIPLVN
ncbi:hypothetical protein GJ496_011549 [Pomphorhynchus laevis]|nr:hypothetical protein GJ496_011549 [Pomphorhynchus laevis]